MIAPNADVDLQGVDIGIESPLAVRIWSAVARCGYSLKQTSAEKNPLRALHFWMLELQFQL
jgi:hypothetical protein